MIPLFRQPDGLGPQAFRAGIGSISLNTLDGIAPYTDNRPALQVCPVADGAKKHSDHCIGWRVNGFDWGNVHAAEFYGLRLWGVPYRAV